MHGQLRPVVPKIIDDAPHIGMTADMPGVFNRRLARRGAENHGPAAMIDGMPDHLDFLFMIGTREIIHFNKVNAPGGVQLKQSIIVRLRAGFGRIERIHIAEPGA